MRPYNSKNRKQDWTNWCNLAKANPERYKVGVEVREHCVYTYLAYYSKKRTVGQLPRQLGTILEYNDANQWYVMSYMEWTTKLD